MKLINNLYEGLRMQLSKGTTYHGARDMYEVLGYPQVVTIKDCRDLYERGDIAARIVEAYPDACWCHPPSAVNDEEDEERNAWETSVDDLLNDLKFWQVINRLDVLCQLGRYAVLYIGFADGDDLEKPVVRGAKPTYLLPMGEDVAKIKSYVTNINDPRFGKPLLYEITVRANASEQAGSSTKLVHYTRVLHIAERTLDDDVFGSSILTRIFNRLLDLEKVVGGGAEIWWLNARGGLSLEADADSEIPDPEAMKAQVENYQHKLTRMITTKGIDVKPIVQTTPSPKDNASVLLSSISGAVGIPQRIMIGSERGELSSSQDEHNWNKRISERRTKHCEPFILDAFLNYMIELNVIKEDEYVWDWPTLDDVSEMDQATIAKDKATALASYANSPEADNIITPRQFVEDVLNMEYMEDELEEMLDAEAADMRKAEEDLAAQKALTENPNGN